MSYWNQHPRICLIARFRKKIKSKFGTKNALFGYFWTRIWKSYCRVWNQQPRICLIAKFCKKQKLLNLGQKKSYLGTFALEFFKKLLSYLKSAPSNLSNCEISQKKNEKQKCLNLGPKIPYLIFRIFGPEFEKTIVIFEINTFEFLQ